MKVRADHTLVIERRREDVFAYLTDVESLPEWQSSVLEARKHTEPRRHRHDVHRGPQVPRSAARVRARGH